MKLLAELPIDPRVTTCGDTGEPIARKYPDSPVGQAFLAGSDGGGQSWPAGRSRRLPEVEL
ncbi:MAG: hypothetical protein U0871_29305 [Gemmataceae bacterium]